MQAKRFSKMHFQSNRKLLFNNITNKKKHLNQDNFTFICIYLLAKMTSGGEIYQQSQINENVVLPKLSPMSTNVALPQLSAKYSPFKKYLLRHQMQSHKSHKLSLVVRPL